MTAKTSFTMMVVILLAIARVAVADLYGINDSNVEGNGNDPYDLLNLTRDTDTARDWLDMTLSLNRSYNDVSTQFGAGGEFEGFRFATEPDLVTLFVQSAGLILEYEGPEPTPEILAFQDLFGSEFFEFVGMDGNITGGRFDDQNPAMVEIGTAWVSDFPVGGDPQVLVRVLPDAGGPFGDPDRVDPEIGAWLVRSSCDFSSDGNCNIDDIDALIMEIEAGTNDTLFDLNGDEMVTLEDVTDENLGWLRLAGEENLGQGLSYLPADITLDGFVDGLDFIEWNVSKFLNTGLWSLGDLNADGFTDGLDFIIWNEFKFMSSDGASAVPEPGIGVLLIATLLGLAVVRRR